jgi:hypothetical protein
MTALLFVLAGLFACVSIVGLVTALRGSSRL